MANSVAPELLSGESPRNLSMKVIASTPRRANILESLLYTQPAFVRPVALYPLA